MPQISGSVSVAANSVNDNVLAGSQFEFLPYDAALEFGLSASATGLSADVYSGQDVLLERGSVNDKSGAAVPNPVYPDDFSLNDVAAAGERIKVRFINDTAGAITAYWNIRIAPF